MSNNRFARYVAVPAFAAGAIGIAALGLAGTASASSSYNPPPPPRHGIVAVPNTYAHPPATAFPGMWWHHHHPSLLTPSAAADIVAPYGG